MNDIKVPPFTDAQKKLIEMTEKLANGKQICDVDGIDDDVRDVKKLLEETITMIEKSNICESCVSKNICGNPNITGCISYTKQDEKFLPINCYVCNASGRITGNGYMHASKCKRCNGTGKINYYTLTNEDFLRTATAEQLAKVLAGFCVKAADDCDKGKTGRLYAPYWRRWLREEYRGNDFKIN